MSQDNEYDIKPPEKPKRPLPGDPDFVPPVPIIEPADPEPRYVRKIVEPEIPVDPDVTNNKAAAILGYILFLIPLVLAPKSKFARFHANQGLMVFILWCVAIFLIVIINVFELFLGHILDKVVILGVFFSCIFYLIQPLLLLGALAFAIIGIINAANGEMKPLPLVGHWDLIKQEATPEECASPHPNRRGCMRRRGACIALLVPD